MKKRMRFHVVIHMCTLTLKFTGKTAVAKRRRVFPVQRLVRHVLQAEYQPHAQRMPTLLMRGVEPIIY